MPLNWWTGHIPGVLAIAQVAFYEENIVEHDLLVNKNKQEKS